MKRFLKRSGLFLGCLVIYGLIMVGINGLIFSFTPSPLSSSRVLIAGDSHLMRSLDPRLFPDAENICVSAEAYAITYWKLQQVIDTVEPDTVLLSLSPANLSSYCDHVFENEDIAAYQFNHSYRVLEVGNMFRDFRVSGKELLKAMVKNLALYPNVKQYDYLGGYAASKGSRPETAAAKINEHYNRPEGPAAVSTDMIGYLDSLIALCERKEITPIVAVTPHHPDYVASVPTSIMNAFQKELSRVEAADVRTINALEWNYADSLYLDADHLNHRGATEFTRRVIASLETPKTAQN